MLVYGIFSVDSVVITSPSQWRSNGTDINFLWVPTSPNFTTNAEAVVLYLALRTSKALLLQQRSSHTHKLACVWIARGASRFIAVPYSFSLCVFFQTAKRIVCRHIASSSLFRVVAEYCAVVRRVWCPPSTAVRSSTACFSSASSVNQQCSCWVLQLLGFSSCTFTGVLTFI